MRKRRVVLACLVVGLSFVAGHALSITLIHARAPVAVQGVYDLTGWDKGANPYVGLKGEWEFYWKQLLEPSDVWSRRLTPLYIDVPGSWTKHQLGGNNLSPEGYATFALTIRTGASGERLALYVPNIATAYRLYINDELSLSAGTVGRSNEETVGRCLAQTIEFDDDRVETKIVIQVSNFIHRRAGLWTMITIGPAKPVALFAHLSLLTDMGSTGALTAMGIYHLCLFWQRKRDRSTLYFGLVCLAFSLRTLLTGQVVLARICPSLTWPLALVIEYFASSAVLPLGAAYVCATYPEDALYPIVPVCTIGWLAFTGITLTGNTIAAARAAVWYQVLDVIVCLFLVKILLDAVTKDRPGSMPVAIGVTFFFITFTIDMLYLFEVTDFGYLAQLGLVFLCFTQSYALSTRFSAAFTSVEQLSEQLASVNRALTDLNRNLEERVSQRTMELMESNRQLAASNTEIARMEEARKHLLTNIAHDLRTPVTLIRGYAEAMLDGVVEGNESRTKYLELIKSKVNGLAILIEDLFELTQLESRKTTFSLRPVEVYDLVEKFYRKYEHDIKNASIEPKMELAPPSKHAPIYVNADLDQIDRTMSNLIYNAVKFTPKGGQIALTCAVIDSEAVIGVRDNGRGISVDDIPFVFDRFYKSPRSRSSAAGSGLGLSIAKEIVELHGGRIWVESKQGSGSTFRFSLPVVTKPEDLYI